MSKRSQRIQIGDLRPGMYVVKLDRPWSSTPFDRQGFPISSAAQVRLLTKYCKSVHVDVDRSVRRSRPVKQVRTRISLARKSSPARKPAEARSRKRATARAR